MKIRIQQSTVDDTIRLTRNLLEKCDAVCADPKESWELPKGIGIVVSDEEYSLLRIILSDLTTRPRN